MKIAIAADHAGLEYKSLLLPYLQKQGYDVLDLGTNKAEPDDYPDHAIDLAKVLLSKKAERGVLICGSGVGVSVAVNKFKGIRAAVCHDTYSAHQGVEHDDMNVLCIGQRVIGIELAREIIFTFLKAEFSKEERHERRLKKIFAIEDKNMKEETI
ncbi:MAG: ribose 5-phosphate isomerase [Bacteroidota bacterium]|nr:ribose 5-phosphate isomerase [Bacteroidota bacterium]